MSFISTAPQSHVGDTDIWLTPLDLLKGVSLMLNVRIQWAGIDFTAGMNEGISLMQDENKTCVELSDMDACISLSEQNQKLRALVEDLSGALGFECGNRCAPQNPCNAKEALERKDAVMSEIDHDPT